MENVADEAETPTVWALLDENAGHRNQVLGVVDALGWPCTERELQYNWRADLPNALLGASVRGLSTTARAAIAPPWPDLVIAAGRKTAPVARAIRRSSGGRVRLVQIMDPGSWTDAFDLIAVPTHDEPGQSPGRDGNVVWTLGAPSRMTPNALTAARETWQPVLSKLASPRIAVFVGGGTRRRAFAETMTDELIDGLRNLKAETGGSLMITTSRRSGHAGDRLAATFGEPGDHVFRWGDTGDNPYAGYLAWADRIVVTGDSVSMLSDACGAGVPVSIYAPPGLITPKHARFHKTLYEGGYAAPFRSPANTPPAERLDTAGDIAAAVRALFA